MKEEEISDRQVVVSYETNSRKLIINTFERVSDSLFSDRLILDMLQRSLMIGMIVEIGLGIVQLGIIRSWSILPASSRLMRYRTRASLRCQNRFLAALSSERHPSSEGRRS